MKREQLRDSEQREPFDRLAGRISGQAYLHTSQNTIGDQQAIMALAGYQAKGERFPIVVLASTLTGR